MPGDAAQNKTPLVSVIMNCYNGEEYLSSAIDSVYAQTYTNWEIIFWDNASTDNSAAIAREYDEKLQVFENDETIPLYAARNCALGKCKGEFIAFLDVDDLWHPDKLVRQVQSMLDNDYSMVYSSFEVINNSGVTTQKYMVRNTSGDVFNHLIKDYNIALVTALLRHSFLSQYNLSFDDNSKYFGDFTLFSLIASKSQVGVIPEVLAYYRHHQRALSSLMSAPAYREEFAVMKKYLCQRVEGNKFELLSAKLDYMLDICIMKKSILDGDIKGARKLLRRYIRSSFKCLCCYLATFFPRATQRWLYSKYFR